MVMLMLADKVPPRDGCLNLRRSTNIHKFFDVHWNFKFILAT